VIEDGEADLDGHYPVVAPVDQEDRRLDAGEVLCVGGGAWKVARRTIVLDANVLLDNKLSVFL
jgi:hypothetical protein